MVEVKCDCCGERVWESRDFPTRGAGYTLTITGDGGFLKGKTVLCEQCADAVIVMATAYLDKRRLEKNLERMEKDKKGEE